jgi:hypothetical protein
MRSDRVWAQILPMRWYWVMNVILLRKYCAITLVRVGKDAIAELIRGFRQRSVCKQTLHTN